MNTIISNWQIVSIVESETLIGKVLWGICIDDMTCRFAKNDYICTSQIMEANFDINLVITASGSLYQLIGKGIKSTVNFDDFELLRHGFSPEQIRALNCSSDLTAH